MTPTPFIYTLKGGDTLLGLAIEFDTTLQAIQDANGITDPRSLFGRPEDHHPTRGCVAYRHSITYGQSTTVCR